MTSGLLSVWRAGVACFILGRVCWAGAKRCLAASPTLQNQRAGPQRRGGVVATFHANHALVTGCCIALMRGNVGCVIGTMPQ